MGAPLPRNTTWRTPSRSTTTAVTAYPFWAPIRDGFSDELVGERRGKLLRGHQSLRVMNRFGLSLRGKAYLAGLDLQRQVLRVDPALREAAGDEPKTRLRGAREH